MPSRRQARVRCGECSACLHPDCGTCQNCVRKKKFGGDGSCNKACIHRQCQNLQMRSKKNAEIEPSETATTSGSEAASSEPVRQSKRRRVATATEPSPSPPTVPYNKTKKTTSVVLEGGRVVTLPNIDYNGRPKGCCMCDPDTHDPIRTFVSLSEAERVLKIGRLAIGKVCREGGGIVDGYYFRTPTPEDAQYLQEQPVKKKPAVAKATVAASATSASSSDDDDEEEEEEDEEEEEQPKRSRRQSKPRASTSTTTLAPSSNKKKSSKEEGYKGKPQACEVSDAETGKVVEIFPSLSLAERTMGISRSSIAAACRQSPRGGIFKGYRFRTVSADAISPFFLGEFDSSGRQVRKASPKTVENEYEESSPVEEKGSSSRQKSKEPNTSSSDGIARRRPRRAASKSISTDGDDEEEEDIEEDKSRGKKKKPSKPPPPLPSHMYGLPLVKRQTDGECGGCHGARNQQAKDEAILLCDGQGCDREYHLGCTHLSEVPEGSFHCEDCDAYGTTMQLRQYLESSAQERADFDTSRAYVESLLHKQLGYKTDEDGDVDDTAKTKLRVPMSELWRLSESHDIAMSDRKINTKTDKEDGVDEPQKPCPPLGPEFLVGKPLRMYCPNGNNYHDGRIIDWRKATHLAPVSGDDDDEVNAFHGTSDVASSEFLVRFPAGANHRKQALHCWMILEEHSLAIGVSLVWGKFDIKGGLRGWKPAQTWLRTSLELVPVCHLLDEAKNQVSYESEYRPGGETWALTKLLGSETHVLLNLETEAVDFFSTDFSSQRASKGQHGKSPTPSSPRKGHDAQNDRQLEIATALAFTESQEQTRTREWYSMPLNNAGHKQAMSIVDESALPPLIMATKEKNHVEPEDNRLPRLCPLIDQGLDRMWVMELLRDRGIEKSLDTAASLSCQLIECSPAAVAKAREEQKTASFGC